MRCPKCGAFMEEGKDTCMMCGVNVRTYIPETNPNAMFSSSNSSAFGSGNDFRTGAFNNSTGAQMQGSNNNSPMGFDHNSYKKATYAPLNDKDKDIFDKYQENKALFNTIFVIIIFALISLVGFFYYRNKTKEVELEPLLQNLYYEVDQSFNAITSGTGGTTASFARTGGTGNDCAITITVGTSAQTANHVDDYFYSIKSSLEPERDASNNIMRTEDIFTASEGETIINGSNWYYMNVFYNDSLTKEPTVLRYKYMTAMDKGMFYDIVLLNYNNDSVCNASLDNFAKSLKFIDK